MAPGRLDRHAKVVERLKPAKRSSSVGRVVTPFFAAAFFVTLALTGSASGLEAWNAVGLSDSVISFGVVTTGVSDSLPVTLTNNLSVPVEVLEAAFDEACFTVSMDGLPIPPGGSKQLEIIVNAEQNIDYTDFLRIELDGGIRPLVVEVSAEAHHADTYYASTQNQWGEDLKSALTAIIDDHTCLGYTLARDHMYGHIDNDSGWVECVYTGRTAFFSTRQGANENGFNCEHTWPQSFSGEAEPMRSDVFHLYPCDATANSMRANLDFGIVVSATWSVGGSKLGTDSEGQTVFEPRDVHKGNVARSHFYYIIRYDGLYNGYQDAAKMEAHFRNWHVSDAVDADEEERNEDIYDLQDNRNPFIDHPEFVDRISSFFGTAVVEEEPEIAAAPAEIDLGTIGFGTTAYHYVAVVNSGNDTLDVSSISSTDPDFDVDRTSFSVAPETYEYVRVSYTSAAVELTDSTDIIILSNDADEASIEIPVTVSVSEVAGITDAEAAAAGLRLYPNHPNPFGTRTTVAFRLGSSARVNLALYDVKGQLVTWIVRAEHMLSGKHMIDFDGGNLPSGVYYCRLEADGKARTGRMLLLK
jgi:endonuclease I